MSKKKEVKTNVMRILDKFHISYEGFSYACDEFKDARQIADLLDLPYEKVYKTLVTESISKKFYVFVIPILKELDLKKAAHVANEKSLSMIHVKDINKITGYIRGGCTAIGMKKQYKTWIDISAEKLPEIIVSGGKLGSQIKLKPNDLSLVTNAVFEDITAPIDK